jgi:hypothetical protein
VSFLIPDGPFDADFRQTFCHFVHFFASPAAADAWVAPRPGSFWLPVADAVRVGRGLAATAFPAVSRASASGVSGHLEGCGALERTTTPSPG